MKLVIIIPAFNEGQVINQVLNGLPIRLDEVDRIEAVVVDDGSSDNTSAEAAAAGATVLRHSINCGLGGAIGTGLAYAKMVDADLALTFDADGQHDPDDIPGMLAPLIAGECDAVVGSRLVNSEGMPLLRTVGNWGMSIATWLLFGTWCTDSQSGLRAFSRKAIQTIEVESNCMEVSSDIIREIGDKHLRLKEVPIKAQYSVYSLGKGQRNFNAVNILARLVVKRLQR